MSLKRILYVRDLAVLIESNSEYELTKNQRSFADLGFSGGFGT